MCCAQPFTQPSGEKTKWRYILCNKKQAAFTLIMTSAKVWILMMKFQPHLTGQIFIGKDHNILLHFFLKYSIMHDCASSWRSHADGQAVKRKKDLLRWYEAFWESFFSLHRKWRDPQFSWDKLYIVIYLKSNFDVVNNVRDCLLRYTVII